MQKHVEFSSKGLTDSRISLNLDEEYIVKRDRSRKTFSNSRARKPIGLTTSIMNWGSKFVGLTNGRL